MSDAQPLFVFHQTPNCMSIIVTIMLLFTSMKMKPTEAHSSLIQKGKASFYSKRLHGKKTTSGERHQSDQLTAAHLSLPMNTLVEVTNLEAMTGSSALRYPRKTEGRCRATDKQLPRRTDSRQRSGSVERGRLTRCDCDAN